MNTRELLKGIKVIELANVLAGPQVGMFLAELGAEVIKIENLKTGGDISRQWKLPEESGNSLYSAYYCSTNWGKTDHLMDLGNPHHQQQVLHWISKADIVISNFKPGAAKRFGMDARSLRNTFPHLIYAQLYAFEETDSRLAFDVVLQAETGFLYMTGEPDGPPVKMPVALIDLLAAHQLKEGILLALLQKARSGKGATVKTSLLKAGLASLASQATNWLMAGHIPQRMGSQHPNIAPYGDLFTTKDGKLIVLAVGTDKQFHTLCEILGIPDLSHQATFASNTQRVTHRARLIGILQDVIGKSDRDELLSQLHSRGVPAGSVRNMQEVFDIQTAQDMILEEERSGMLTQRIATVAFTIEM